MSPVAIPISDSTALSNGLPSWGVHVTLPDRADIVAVWVPVVVTAAWERQRVGAFAATSNTGELSAMYHALDWISNRRNCFPPPEPRPK